MNKILAIRSANYGFFNIGISNDGYFLRNVHTVIPNEFRKYSSDKIKEMFDYLCECIPECLEVPAIHVDKNDFRHVYVLYDDMTEHLYRDQDEGDRILTHGAREAADYTEFFEEKFMWSINPGTLSIDRLRLVCEKKIEDFDVFYEAVQHTDLDDYTFWEIRNREDGGLNIFRQVFMTEEGEYITIMKDGRIGNTGDNPYVELLKEYDVKIINMHG